MPGVLYQDVVKVLLDRFPEFMESQHYIADDLEFSYAIWGGFGRFVTNHMRRIPADRLDDDPFVAKVFDFTNELMDSDDPDTQTIVVIELLEQFYMYQKTLELARRKLKREHLTWLERQSWVGTPEDLHYEGELIAPQGLEALREPLSRCSWDIKVRRDYRYSPLFMESHDSRIRIEMDRTEEPCYAFFGSAGTAAKSDVELACGLLDELSQILMRGDIVHRIRLYRTGLADVLVGYFHHLWPRENDASDDSHS